MDILEQIIDVLEFYVWQFGFSVGDQTVPLMVLGLLGVGVFLTFRLRFVQVRRFAHGLAVTSGIYDDPSEPGDVTHFQALSTALSATVGIGNIAGVAIAIHFGGPGALFWMWVTAVLGMAIKFSEVTLAQYYRQTETGEEGLSKRLVGTVSGGPMYYIEQGLGKNWVPLAIFSAAALMATSFFTGNAIQANTVADVMTSEFAVPAWAVGVITMTIVGLVILGGIRRIGAVTGILTPAMAVIYVLAAFVILTLNYNQILPSLGRIFADAFNPTAGVAGTGTGAFLLTLMWGVRRGLFSNEAGMGSAPIAHAAAKTDEPVSEGVVALLEPFIDTIVVCTMTGLVILTTGAWGDPVPSEFNLSSGDMSFREQVENERFVDSDMPDEIEVEDGQPLRSVEEGRLSWHGYPIERFYVDAPQETPFSGTIYTDEGRAVAANGQEYTVLYGDAPETGAPLTRLAFERGLETFGSWGGYIVLISVLLFAISTSISWSYYGDRCANYLFGHRAILPYKIAFLVLHFLGAIGALSIVWTIGDIGLGLTVFPNLIALVLLSGVVVKATNSYFSREPWYENYEVQRRIREEQRQAEKQDE
jgi:AGCS family alanine or glycine:cation symporter